MFSSLASAETVVAGEKLAMLLFEFQRTQPLASDRTRFVLLCKASIADERSVIGAARLATHTTVRCGMLLYHIPT